MDPARLPDFFNPSWGESLRGRTFPHTPRGLDLSGRQFPRSLTLVGRVPFPPCGVAWLWMGFYCFFPPLIGRVPPPENFWHPGTRFWSAVPSPSDPPTRFAA